MLIVKGVPPLGGIKQWWGGENSYFVAKCVNISKTMRYVQSYYIWLIGSCMCVFDWH